MTTVGTIPRELVVVARTRLVWGVGRCASGRPQTFRTRHIMGAVQSSEILSQYESLITVVYNDS